MLVKCYRCGNTSTWNVLYKFSITEGIDEGGKIPSMGTYPKEINTCYCGECGAYVWYGGIRRTYEGWEKGEDTPVKVKDKVGKIDFSKLPPEILKLLAAKLKEEDESVSEDSPE